MSGKDEESAGGTSGARGGIDYRELEAEVQRHVSNEPMLSWRAVTRPTGRVTNAEAAREIAIGRIRSAADRAVAYWSETATQPVISRDLASVEKKANDLIVALRPTSKREFPDRFRLQQELVDRLGHPRLAVELVELVKRIAGAGHVNDARFRTRSWRATLLEERRRAGHPLPLAGC